MRNSYLHIIRIAVSAVILCALAAISLVPRIPATRVPLLPSTPMILAADKSSTGGYDLKWDHLNTVKRYSDAYNIDWRLVLSMIRQESSFDPQAVSERGAVGLMQLMPVTTMELTEELNLSSPDRPESNLHAGIHYFSKLLGLFPKASPEDRICLALAAYNAGPGRVYDAQELAAYYNENPDSWQTIQHLLPLLSKRYYSLHQNVWGTGRPPNGYFGSGGQTIAYVGHIIGDYHMVTRLF